MFHLLGASLLNITNLFASAGGGGSGGGGGGGGAGAGIFFIGYAPMHVVGAFIRKAKKHEAEWVFGQGMGWTIALIYLVLIIVPFIHSSLIGLSFIAAAGSPVGMGAGLYGWFGKIRQSRMTKQALVAAAQNDKAWDEATLLDKTKTIFLKYQEDWSAYDVQSMRNYMTIEYYNHAVLMMGALKLAARQDDTENPVISLAEITEIYDANDNNQDAVIVGFTASAKDKLIDTRENKIIYENDKSFSEFWRFIRNGDDWYLDGIQPATADKWSSNASLEAFAKQQGYYYSLDWGYLLLPTRGQLFGEGKFGVSDINNHVIGQYKDNIIQLYTYITNPQAAGSKTYLIAQTSVPKSYGEILVRHKSGIHLFGVHGLNKISTEWPDFNKKYDVYASDVEQVTSFELLDPVYMEQLEALPFEVNINVVDNVVYLYTRLSTEVGDSDKYASLLAVLQKAFEAMRL